MNFASLITYDFPLAKTFMFFLWLRRVSSPLLDKATELRINLNIDGAAPEILILADGTKKEGWRVDYVFLISLSSEHFLLFSCTSH